MIGIVKFALRRPSTFERAEGCRERLVIRTQGGGGGIAV
jgi:hypothetical protein